MGRAGLLLAVAAGGALGTLARYGLSHWLGASASRTFPIGTLAANLIGCLAIGFFYVWFENRGSPALRDFVRVGLLGGLTTFSSYCIESISLMEKGQYGLAALNIFGSVAGGLLAAVGGIALARLVLSS
jgi:fluoride exporter